MASLAQYGTLVVALLLGGGFAFGGIASYAGLVGSNTDSSQQQRRAVMPSQNYQEQPFNMSVREQRVLAYNNDVVFVNAFYDTAEQKQELQSLQNLPDRFDGRVYVSLANSTSNSDIMISYGLVDFPSVIVAGASGTSQPGNMTNSAVSDAVCASFRSLGDQSAQCL